MLETPIHSKLIWEEGDRLLFVSRPKRNSSHSELLVGYLGCHFSEWLLRLQSRFVTFSCCWKLKERLWYTKLPTLRRLPAKNMCVCTLIFVHSFVGGCSHTLATQASEALKRWRLSRIFQCFLFKFVSLNNFWQQKRETENLPQRVSRLWIFLIRGELSAE